MIPIMAEHVSGHRGLHDVVHFLDRQSTLRLRQDTQQFGDVAFRRQQSHASVVLDDEADSVALLQTEPVPDGLGQSDLSFAAHLGFAHGALPNM